MAGIIRNSIVYAQIYDVHFQSEIKGLAKVEKVLLDTADSVMDTKRKIEFGVKNIAFKVSNIIMWNFSSHVKYLYKDIKCISSLMYNIIKRSIRLESW